MEKKKIRFFFSAATNTIVNCFPVFASFQKERDGCYNNDTASF